MLSPAQKPNFNKNRKREQRRKKEEKRREWAKERRSEQEVEEEEEEDLLPGFDEGLVDATDLWESPFSRGAIQLYLPLRWLIGVLPQQC